MAKEARKTQKEEKVKEKNKKAVKKNDTKKKSPKVVKEKELKTKDIIKEEKVKEKVVKEPKVKKEKVKRNNERLTSALKKVDDNRKAIILFIVGFLLATLIFRCIFWPDRIATLKDGTQPVANIGETIFTADDLYQDMKKQYSVNALINEIDDVILTEKYPSDKDMESEVKNTADYYYSVYESNAGLTKEEFLSQYGFASEKDFLDELRLDHRRNKYYEEYALSLVADKDVEKYYKDQVFGDVDSKHILVSVKRDGDKEGLSDAEAKKLANEIIGKLNKGTSWEDVIKEYGDKIIDEELGYNAFNASLEKAYLKECRDLKVGTYSKSPVLTSYGYHIVYKIAQKDKPEFSDVEDDIKDILADEKKDKDSNLYYKSLIHMRKEAKLEFVDTKFKDAYNDYVNNYK